MDIVDLQNEFERKVKSKDVNSLEKQQQKLIEKLQKEITFEKEKNKVLEDKLNQIFPDQLIYLTPEELICIKQIEHLKASSDSRILSLEEAKKLEILIKSLNLIRENKPTAKDSSSFGIEEGDLLAIVNAGDKNQSNA